MIILNHDKDTANLIIHKPVLGLKFGYERNRKNIVMVLKWAVLFMGSVGIVSNDWNCTEKDYIRYFIYVQYVRK